MRLTRKRVVEAARELVNDSGLDALTTRQLGDRLGVKGPAIYRHFKSKQDIIDALALTFFLVPDAPGPDCKWEDWLTTVARCSRSEILACRDGSRIIARAKPPQLRLDPDTYLRPLTDVGFTRAEAFFASHLIGRFVMGWTRAEQEHGGRTPPYDANLDSEEAFTFCLKTVIAGLQTRLIARRLTGETPTADAQR